MMDVYTRVALRRAEEHSIDVKLYQLSRQWICSVEGQLIHINDLSRLVNESIAKKIAAEQNKAGASILLEPVCHGLNGRNR